MEQIGKIIRINGPLVTVRVTGSVQIMEMVYVSHLKLIGEILKVEDGIATVQVYETTEGIKIHEEVYGSGLPLSVELGPGLLSQMFDGIQRPLNAIENQTKSIFLQRGVFVKALDREKKWQFTPTVAVGDVIQKGGVIGTVPETELLLHHVMVAPNISGTIKTILSGLHTVEDVIGTLEDAQGKIHELKLYHRWPVKKPRPYQTRFLPNQPLVTGQRVLDTYFPVAKGGAVAIPGGFGTGKTITQHQLAKWSDAKVVVYVGCGERGNEITEVIEEFPKLIDPHTKRPLFERTVMIANTSNMPVTAREASIYTGITIAEYYRDMGYDVAVMADSSSRWAEALREMSGRLEEIPAEEGFPAYLGSKLASFYERAGSVQMHNGNKGSVTMIAAVSPPGGDFSEPVTQNTKRFVRGFWQLDKSLAAARHFPSINWLYSYSEYADYVAGWWEQVDSDYVEIRNESYGLLLKEEKLQKIVKLIGPDALPDRERLILDVVQMIKEGFLKQNAYDDVDMYCVPKKQLEILRLILAFYKKAEEIISLGAPVFEIRSLESFAMIIRARLEIPNDKLEEFDKLRQFVESEMAHLESKYRAVLNGGK